MSNINNSGPLPPPLPGNVPAGKLGSESLDELRVSTGGTIAESGDMTAKIESIVTNVISAKVNQPEPMTRGRAISLSSHEGKRETIEANKIGETRFPHITPSNSSTVSQAFAVQNGIKTQELVQPQTRTPAPGTPPPPKPSRPNRSPSASTTETPAKTADLGSPTTTVPASTSAPISEPIHQPDYSAVSSHQPDYSAVSSTSTPATERSDFQTKKIEARITDLRKSIGLAPENIRLDKAAQASVKEATEQYAKAREDAELTYQTALPNAKTKGDKREILETKNHMIDNAKADLRSSILQTDGITKPDELAQSQIKRYEDIIAIENKFQTQLKVAQSDYESATMPESHPTRQQINAATTARETATSQAHEARRRALSAGPMKLAANKYEHARDEAELTYWTACLADPTAEPNAAAAKNSALEEARAELAANLNVLGASPEPGAPGPNEITETTILRYELTAANSELELLNRYDKQEFLSQIKALPEPKSSKEASEQRELVNTLRDVYWEKYKGAKRKVIEINDKLIDLMPTKTRTDAVKKGAKDFKDFLYQKGIGKKPTQNVLDPDYHMREEARQFVVTQKDEKKNLALEVLLLKPHLYDSPDAMANQWKRSDLPKQLKKDLPVLQEMVVKDNDTLTQERASLSQKHNDLLDKRSLLRMSREQRMEKFAQNIVATKGLEEQIKEIEVKKEEQARKIENELEEQLTASGSVVRSSIADHMRKKDKLRAIAKQNLKLLEDGARQKLNQLTQLLNHEKAILNYLDPTKQSELKIEIEKKLMESENKLLSVDNKIQENINKINTINQALQFFQPVKTTNPANQRKLTDDRQALVNERKILVYKQAILERPSFERHLEIRAIEDAIGKTEFEIEIAEYELINLNGKLEGNKSKSKGNDYRELELEREKIEKKIETLKADLREHQLNLEHSQTSETLEEIENKLISSEKEIERIDKDIQSNIAKATVARGKDHVPSPEDKTRYTALIQRM